MAVVTRPWVAQRVWPRPEVAPLPFPAPPAAELDQRAMATALRKAQSSVARWTVEAANVRNAGGVSARNRSTLWLRLAAAGAMLAAAWWIAGTRSTADLL